MDLLFYYEVEYDCDGETFDNGIIIGNSFTSAVKSIERVYDKDLLTINKIDCIAPAESSLVAFYGTKEEIESIKSAIDIIKKNAVW